MLIILVYIFNGFLNIAKSQNTAREVTLKMYKSRDTTALNKDAVLILFSNNTFINYGIYFNKGEQDWYVWYTAGRWINSKDKVLMRTYETIENQQQLITDIKNAFQVNKSHSLIEKYYEFVQLNYRDYIVIMDDDLVVDPTKNILYFETLYN